MQLTVTPTAQQVPSLGAQALLLQNLGALDIWVDNVQTVTAGTGSSSGGARIEAGSSAVWPITGPSTAGGPWVICDSGQTVRLAVVGF